MSGATPRVTLAIAEGVAEVRLNRPDKLNAVDQAMLEEIAAVQAALAAREDLACVVLAGEGRAFCAGIDLASFAGAATTGDLAARTHGAANLFQAAAWGWRSLPVPVIAAVHGYVFGAGCQIMLGADLRLIAPDSEVSVMEMRWGLVPDMGGMALARGLVRDDHWRELVYTARRVGAEEAVALGLATRLAAAPLAEARALAKGIAGASGAAMRAAKRLVTLPAGTPAEEILLAEAREQQALLASPWHRAALKAQQQGGG